jgi:hypothetical protein
MVHRKRALSIFILSYYYFYFFFMYFPMCHQQEEGGEGEVTCGSDFARAKTPFYVM